MGTSATTEPNGSRRLRCGRLWKPPMETAGRPRERRGKKGDSGYSALAGQLGTGKTGWQSRSLGRTACVPACSQLRWFRTRRFCFSACMILEVYWTGRCVIKGMREVRSKGLLFQLHTISVIAYGGGPIAEDTENAHFPVQNIQHFHHIAFAPYRRIESLVIKAVITVGE